MRVRRPYIAAVLVAVALGLALFPESPRAQAPARVQFVFTSDAHYGITEQGDGAETRLSTLMGMNSADGRGNIMIGVDWTKRDGVFQRMWFGGAVR